MENSLGLSHFIQHTDGVGIVLLTTLLLMSVATWFLIAAKTIANRRMTNHRREFLKMFHDAQDLGAVNEWVRSHGVSDPFSHLTHHALKAADQYRQRSGNRLIENTSPEDFLTRALRRAIEQDTARLEHGHTALASVASSAPFVGLFGTVWGIYHALLNIGLSGQSSLDQIAGPVGEALIMTALGLAVAIPAVLAYNAFNRANRLMLSELDGFAHDLFAYMSTGIRLHGAPPSKPQTPAVARAA